MESIIINNQTVLENLPALIPNGKTKSSTAQPFIEANTIHMEEEELKNKHVIPVWTSTNEPLISHTDFIETVQEATAEVFSGEQILLPSIRVSHPIKGRIPEAKNKPASQLESWEETLYYERMMFIVEIPTIKDTIDGNTLSLTIGGVKAYNLDNVYSKRVNSDQQFKLFIGFKNRVCCNLCVWSDGLQEEVKVTSLGQLKSAVQFLLESYNIGQHLNIMRGLQDHYLSEREFAQIVGRARMYKYLPEKSQKDIEPLLLGDQQLGVVAKDYYQDKNFARATDGSINLWKMYNLLTGANKSTYIDQFLKRTSNANEFVQDIAQHKAGYTNSWYLS
jgi:hypothetical protein